MFELSWHLVYVRAKSRTLRYLFMFERSREPSWHHVYVRAESRTLFTFEPFWHLVYVRAESRTLRYLFMFERSREPFLCSNLSETLFMFERSREPCSTCLRSSGVENPVLLDTLFTFERSREPCATWHLVYVRAESRTPFRIVHQNSIFES
jgi:hypothetical protein